jgi:hypothetical protein
MNRRWTPWLAGALACALAVPTTGAERTLTASNFVDVGDALTDVLVTSGLAFSTLVGGTTSGLPVWARVAAFQPPMSEIPPPRASSPCPGGGQVATRMHDEDRNGAFSVNDRFVTVFESCVIDGRLVTGRSEFVVATHRFDGPAEVTELEFRFRELGTTDLRWTGAARVTLRSDLRRGNEHHVVQYRDLAVIRGARHMRWNFALDVVRPPIGEQVARLDGGLTVDGLRLALNQDEPYVIASSGYPRSGQLTARDRVGTRLQVEAGPRAYRYRFFEARNTGEHPDASSRSRAYGVR